MGSTKKKKKKDGGVFDDVSKNLGGCFGFIVATMFFLWFLSEMLYGLTHSWPF